MVKIYLATGQYDKAHFLSGGSSFSVDPHLPQGDKNQKNKPCLKKSEKSKNKQTKNPNQQKHKLSRAEQREKDPTEENKGWTVFLGKRKMAYFSWKTWKIIKGFKYKIHVVAFIICQEQ